MELGALGLLTYLALLAAVIGIGVRDLLKRGRDTLSTAHRWILVGLVSLIVARIIEEIPVSPECRT